VPGDLSLCELFDRALVGETDPVEDRQARVDDVLDGVKRDLADLLRVPGKLSKREVRVRTELRLPAPAAPDADSRD
jgi:hypothetical protein